MGFRRQVFVLVGLLVTACVGLAGLAWRSASQESAQAELRYRERAEANLDAGEMACAEVLAEVIARGGAEVTSQAQVLPAPSPRPSAAWEGADFRAADLALARDPLAAEVSLLSFAEEARAKRPADAAAALSAAASLARRAGRLPLARERWEAVLDLERERGPLYTQRGLRWAWIGAFQLGRADAESGQADRLLALLRELQASGEGPASPSQLVLRGRIADVLAGHGLASPALEQLRRAEEAQLLPRRLRLGGASVAALRSWTLSGAVPQAFELAFDWRGRALPSGEARVIAVAVEPGRARVMTLADATQAALGRPRLSAYAQLGLELRALVPGSDLPAPEAPIVARRALSGPFSGVELQVLGREQEAFLAAERRRLRQTLGLIGGALLLLVLGSAFVLRSLLREAETARAQRNFVAAVTHELKTPLASIHLLGELLAEGGVDEAKAKEFAQKVVAEADRLAALVSTVLDLSRAEEGIDPAACELVGAQELAEEALERLRLPAERAGATLQLSASADLPELRSDRSALVGVLANLLDNSLKYGDAREAIELELSAAGGRVRFVVRDRGPGVPVQDRERIFAPFHRVQDEMTREQPGVGLGLALARSVAEAHGGSLRYAPRSGGGSEFVLEVPAAEGPT